MKEGKKVLLAITKSNWGGAQRYVYDLATGLRDIGDEVIVVCGDNGLLVTPLIDRLKEANIRVSVIGSLGRDISIREDMRAMRELARIIRTEKPDVLHINSAKMGGLGTLLGRLLRVPRVIFTAHGWAFNESRPFWQKSIIRLASWTTVLLAHQTILVSKETGRQLGFPWLLLRCTVIYNGLSREGYLARENARAAVAEVEPRLAEHINDNWVLSIGELHPIKGHDLMIEAMHMLTKQSSDSRQNIRHIIIGGGEMHGELQSKISSMGLDDHVFLLGNLPLAAKCILATDIFVLPSRSEALPYVLIEACGAGVPIVASAVGGIPEVITSEKDGILVPPGDAKNFFHAIEHLFEDDVLRTRLAGNAKIRADDFSLVRMINETREIYYSK